MELKKEILFYAFRYALGRSTYTVSDVAYVLKTNWDDYSPREKGVFKKDIQNAIDDGKAGMDMDVKKWKEILDLK